MTSMTLFSPTLISAKAAVWIAVAPHEAAYGEWRFFKVTGGDVSAGIVGPLPGIALGLPKGSQGALVIVVAPLTRCIVMGVDLPPLQGAKLQQALTGVLGDRLIGAGGPQHYAAAPIEDGRIREAATCDAAWLKQCVDAVAAAGLRVAWIVPEASLLPKGAAWWGRLYAEQSPAWLVRSANGEAVRIASPLLDAVLPPKEDIARATWQWFADPACDEPPVREAAAYTAMGTAALVRGAAKMAWDLRQFAFAAPDRSARFMNWCANIAQQRSGRFALGALLAVVVINVLGLNLYALKQKHDINSRLEEMERIVTQALPGAPRLLDPGVQLEAAWQRTRNAGNHSGASLLLGVFAQTGNGQALTALDISEQVLRAKFSDGTALERNWQACQAAATSEPLLRAGVRCRREGEHLLLDFARNSMARPG